MQASPERLRRILSPLTPSAFFQDYWGQQHIHIIRASPGFYDAVVSVGDLDAVLQSEQTPAAFIRVIQKGQDIKVADWSHAVTTATGVEQVAIPKRLFGLCFGGAALILNQAHRVLTKLGQACRDLTSELGFSARANVYITPPESQAFARHSDAHESLILQIAGCRSWRLYPTGVDEVTIDLSAGDLLYMPRGLEHEAKAGSKPSIHVSLGLNPHYAFQLVEEFGAMLCEDPWFRQPVPPFFSNEESRRKFEVEFQKRAGKLFASTPVSVLLERRNRTFGDHQSSGWSGRLPDLLQIGDIDAETTVCARSDILSTVEEDGESLHLRFAGGAVTVPRFLRVSLDHIRAGRPFAVRSLPGLLSDLEKVALVRRFVMSGFVGILKT